MNIFQLVKKSVTARQAAERYGLKVNRNGMACCPFHQDRHPSMKVDQGFCCFACGAKGDVITFTGKLFGMSPYEAAKKLITDFNLPIPLKEQKSVQNKSRDREGKKVQSRYHFSVKSKVKTWKNHAVKVLTDYMSWIRFWKQFYGSGPEPFEQECFLEALDNERKINDYLDILLTGDGEEIAEFFIYKRKEVEKIEQRMEEYQRGVVEEIRAYCRAGNADAGRDPGQSGSDGKRQDPPVYPELQVCSGT